MKHILTLLLCAALVAAAHAQTYFYIDQIEVQPEPTTDQDQISVALRGGLASTGAYVVSASASVVGNTVTISITAADDGGATVIVPHTELVPLGLLSAGVYAVVIDGQNVEDLSPVPQHQFTVSGSGAPCDDLSLISVRWHAFSDTAIIVHVMNATLGGELFDYPNFILFDANGDTLAKETVNFFGIAEESYHTLSIMDDVVIPVNTFSATLELWTGFTTALACTWDLDVDLCPTEACANFFPSMGNYGGALVLGTFNWTIQNEEAIVASGQFDMTEVDQYLSANLCLPPGNYQMDVSPTGPPTGGAPMFFVTDESGQSTALWPVVWSLPVALPVSFFGPCIDGTNSLDEPDGTPFRIVRTPTGIVIEHMDGQPLGTVHLFDIQGRLMHTSQGHGDRVIIPIPSFGIHVIRLDGHTLKVPPNAY